MFRQIFLVVFVATAVSGCSSSKTYDSWKSGAEAAKPIFAKANECSTRVSIKHSAYISNYPSKDDPQISQKVSNTSPISKNFIEMALATNSDLAECDALRYQAASMQHFLYGKVISQHMERKTLALNDLSNGKFKTVGQYVKKRMELVILRDKEAREVWGSIKLQIDQEKAQSRESFSEAMHSFGKGLEAYDKQQREMMGGQNRALICRKADGYSPGTMFCQ